MVSDHVAALLCMASYEKMNPVIPAGWYRAHFLDDSNGLKKGLGISIFNNDALNTTVIAYRGTDQFKNLVTDAGLVLQWPIDTALSAQIEFERYKEIYKANKIFMGHSLGGALASHMALNYNLNAVLFDSPGCLQLLSESPHFSCHLNLIRNICGYPNLINTCHSHVGTLMYADTSEYIQDLLSDASNGGCMAGIANTRILWKSTFDLHRLSFIEAYLARPSATIKYVSKWCNSANVVGRGNVAVAIRDFTLSDVPVDNIVNPDTEVASLEEDGCLSGYSLRRNFHPIEGLEVALPSKMRTASRNFWTYDRNNWLITVVNICKSSLSFGHAALVVEGRNADGSLYFGRYEIMAWPDPAANWAASFNTKGKISRVTVLENSIEAAVNLESICQANYDRDSCEVLADQARQVIKIFKADQMKVLRGDRIEFQLLGTGKTGGLIQRILSDPNGGVNCTEYIMNAFKAAGIDIGDDKPKPSVLQKLVARMNSL